MRSGLLLTFKRNFHYPEFGSSSLRRFSSEKTKDASEKHLSQVEKLKEPSSAIMGDSRDTGVSESNEKDSIVFLPPLPRRNVDSIIENYKKELDSVLNEKNEGLHAFRNQFGLTQNLKEMRKSDEKTEKRRIGESGKVLALACLLCKPFLDSEWIIWSLTVI